jgi:hypothetical protein
MPPLNHSRCAGQIKIYVGGYHYFFDKTGALEDERAALTAG